MSDKWRDTCNELLERIDGNDRKKARMKLKTLMEEFEYTATYRVRQSSLQRVLNRLQASGISYHLPNTASAGDWITLSRAAMAPPSATSSADHESAPSPVATSGAHLPTTKLDPLSFVFELDDDRFGDAAPDLLAAIWTCEPVCLLVEAPDEFLTLAAGIFASVMRRRAAMVRHSWSSGALPLAPAILNIGVLRQLVGQGSDAVGAGDFPRRGAVYLVRDLADEVQEDELTAFVREAFIPHTYRLRARFDATTAHASKKETSAALHAKYPEVLNWIAAYAGAPSSREMFGADTGLELQLASLFAEANQFRDIMLGRATLSKTDSSFTAGFESTEHMALKSLLLTHLRTTHPNDKISVEEDVEIHDDPDRESYQQERSEKARPDIRIGKKLWVEVETLRGLSHQGSNPFFALELKLRRKLEAMQQCDEVWIIVPSDVALLATPQLCAVVRNLCGRGGAFDKFKLGFVDFDLGSPVFLAEDFPPRRRVRIDGTSWRLVSRQEPAEKVTMEDIAGYESFKARMSDEVLDPLQHPAKYSRFGVTAPNGLLLYGLPGCGKSLMGRALAGEADLLCKIIIPSDLTSRWIGWGVEKIRDLFDWALKQPACLLVIDELDAVAPDRSNDGGIHSDEKRQVNELLAQLDRIAGKSVAVVATTNYMRGIDSAIRRSGRFDIKLPVFPPQLQDRRELFEHYLTAKGACDLRGTQSVDVDKLAQVTRLFTCSDIKTAVQSAIRAVVLKSDGSTAPGITTDDLLARVYSQPRSLHSDQVTQWLKEATQTLQPSSELEWLRDEANAVFGSQAAPRQH